MVCECARWGVPRVKRGQDVGTYGGMGGLIVKATRQEHNQEGVLCRCAGAAYKIGETWYMDRCCLWGGG